MISSNNHSSSNSSSNNSLNFSRWSIEMNGALVKYAIEQVDDHYIKKGDFSKQSWACIIKKLSEQFTDKTSKFDKNKLLSHFKDVLLKDHKVWRDIKLNSRGIYWSEEQYCFLFTEDKIDTLDGFFSGKSVNKDIFLRNKKKLSIMKFMFMTNCCFYLSWIDKYLFREGDSDLSLIDYGSLDLTFPKLAKSNYNSKVYSKSIQFKKVPSQEEVLQQEKHDVQGMHFGMRPSAGPVMGHNSQSSVSSFYCSPQLDSRSHFMNNPRVVNEFSADPRTLRYSDSFNDAANGVFKSPESNVVPGYMNYFQMGHQTQNSQHSMQSHQSQPSHNSQQFQNPFVFVSQDQFGTPFQNGHQYQTSTSSDMQMPAKDSDGSPVLGFESPVPEYELNMLDKNVIERIVSAKYERVTRLANMVHKLHQLGLITIDSQIVYSEYMKSDKARITNDLLLDDNVPCSEKAKYLNEFVSYLAVSGQNTMAEKIAVQQF